MVSQKSDHEGQILLRDIIKQPSASKLALNVISILTYLRHLVFLSFQHFINTSFLWSLEHATNICHFEVAIKINDVSIFTKKLVNVEHLLDTFYIFSVAYYSMQLNVTL